MITLKAAIRNITRNQRRSFLTVLMIAVGFALCAFTLAFLDGNYGAIIEIFTKQDTGHLQISHKDHLEKPGIHKNIKNYPSVLNRLEKSELVKSAFPRIKGAAMVYSKNKTAGAMIIGIDSEREKAANSYQKRISSGQELRKELEYHAIVGFKIAKILKISIGDEIALISQGADGSIANELFKVAGIIGNKQMSKDDFRIYLKIEEAAEFFTLGNRAHEISVLLDDQRSVKSFVSNFKDKNQNINAKPWQQVEEEFYTAMEADTKGNYFALSIIMFMIGLGILNTMLMSILERSREFGVLKALGTKPSQILRMIIAEGLIFAVIGIASGAVLGTALIYYFNVNGIVLDEPINFAGLSMEVMKTDLNFGSAFKAPTIIVSLTCFFASLYPGFRAANTSVSKALSDRY